MDVRSQLRFASALALLAAVTSPAFALDPQTPAGRYRRTTFTTEDGLGANIINDILQTTDGFLWIASHTGLTRFDGQHFTHVPSQKLILNVHSIAESPSGDLWLGTGSGVFSISPHILEEPGEPRVSVYHLGSGSDDVVWRVRFGHDGTLWVGTRRGLYRWNGASDFSQVVSGFSVNRIEEAPDGHILVQNSNGYMEWDGVRAVDHPEVVKDLGIRPNEVFQVFPDRQGALWFSTADGLFRKGSGTATKIGGRGKATYQTLEDSAGNYWISADGGVYRVRGKELEAVATDVKCRALLADRDGGLWIGTNGDGLIHLQDRTVHMFTTADGLRSDVVMATLTDRSGKLWVGTNCGGIAWFDGDRFHPLPDKDHRADCAYSLTEDDNGDLLVGTYGAGVFRLHDGQLTPYLSAPALPNDIIPGILNTHDGSLWIATTRGLARLRDAQLRTYTTVDGLSDINVRYLLKDGRGTFWAATATGVDQLVGDRLSEVIRRPDPVMLGEDRGNLYIRFGDGVSRFAGGKVSVAFPSFANANTLIAASNELWLPEHDGIVRTTAEGMKRWEQDQGTPVDYAVFTRADGMRSAECTDAGMGPHITITPDGRLWVATLQGLAMIDLPHLPRDAGKPVVYVRDTVVGRKSQRPGSGLVLPPGTRHVELAFDPVELSAPHRIRLQFKLDGVDDGWLDAPPSHVATYSGMRPGSHTFHVRSTNRDGVWDLVGMTYQVTQVPFVYQTAWFQALGVALFLGMLCGLYWYRIRRLAHEFNVRLEERVIERTRIARELHDTLLQSFQGLMLRLQVVDYLLPEGEAKTQLDQTLQRGDQAIAEGRTAVYDLRSSTTTTNDLAAAMKALGEELGTPDSGAFRLEVVGSHRDLHPIIRDEIYRIAREALRNAFGHAEAHHIETEITYDQRAMRLHIRDDGKGIPSEFLEEGRHGHYGLCGMRERARQIGGKLEIWSRPGAGTEIELTIPGSIAYRRRTGRRAFRFFRRKQVEV